MKSLKEIRDHCEIEQDEKGEHWIWAGRRCKKNYPMCRSLNLATGKSETMSVLRAGWQMANMKSIEPHRKIYSVCGVKDCCNPAHARNGTYAQFGAHIRKSGAWVGLQTKVAGSRRGSIKRTKMTPELARECQTCGESLTQMAARLGLTVRQCARARSGLLKCFEPVGSMFTGLMASNTKWSVRA